MKDCDAAKLLISCLDLTSLNTNDTEEHIIKLCQKAHTDFGNVAAICVFSKFVPTIKKVIKSPSIKVATVANFPQGGNDIDYMQAEVKRAIELGADEIDVVFPYNQLLSGNEKFCHLFVSSFTKECAKKCQTKIILETGILQKTRLIETASNICLEHGANFLKTSTGKTETSATVEAANIMLECIKNSKSDCGFKASGGIKSFEDARQYLVLAQVIMGKDWVSPKHLRIGASLLIDDLVKTAKEGY